MSTIYLTVIYWSSLCTNMHQLCHKSRKKFRWAVLEGHVSPAKRTVCPGGTFVQVKTGRVFSGSFSEFVGKIRTPDDTSIFCR